MAPGAQVGVANTGSRLLFDCMTAATASRFASPMERRRAQPCMTNPGMMSSDLRALVAADEGWLVVSDGTVDSTPQGVACGWLRGKSFALYNPQSRPVQFLETLTYGELVIGPTQAWMIAHDGVHGHEWHRWRSRRTVRRLDHPSSVMGVRFSRSMQ